MGTLSLQITLKKRKMIYIYEYIYIFSVKLIYNRKISGPHYIHYIHLIIGYMYINIYLGYILAYYTYVFYIFLCSQISRKCLTASIIFFRRMLYIPKVRRKFSERPCLIKHILCILRRETRRDLAQQRRGISISV